MAIHRVTQVSVGVTTDDRHEHVTGVELNDRADLRFSRAAISADLKNPNGHRYYTRAGGFRADVVVRACPRCAREDYITTDPDKTARNDLLNLPRF